MQEPEASCIKRKEMTMSNQPENEMQQPLTAIEASQQALVELSDEELTQVAGGGFGILNFVKGMGNTIGHEFGAAGNTIGHEFGAIGNTIGHGLGAIENTIGHEFGTTKNTIGHVLETTGKKIEKF
jgi:hypothetical protein